VARIAASIRRFGLVRLPVLATWPGQDAGVVIAGNGVSAALRLLRTGQPDNPPAGITPDWGVPVRPMWFPSQQEAEAYGLADNWIAQDSHDDPALVEVILTEFEAMGVDTDTICVPPEYLLGGDEPGEEPATDEDDAPSEDDTLPDSKLGEVYELGPHRLVCGDALSQPRLTYDCIVFDPPWDVPALASMNLDQSGSVLVFGDGSTLGEQIALRGAPAWIFTWDCVSSWWTPNRPLRRAKMCAWYGDIAAYDQHGHHYKPDDFDPHEKRTVSNSRGAVDWEADPRGRMLSDVYSHPITQLHSDGEHSHKKPLTWVAMLIANTTKKGGIVYDPFGGSGTTLIAAAQTGRVARLVELNPRYCDVIRRRWTRYAKENGWDAGTGALEPAEVTNAPRA